MRSPRSAERCRVAPGMPASSQPVLRCGCPSGGPGRSWSRCATRPESSPVCTTISHAPCRPSAAGSRSAAASGPTSRSPGCAPRRGQRAPARAAAGHSGGEVHTPEAVAVPLLARARRRKLRGDRRLCADSRRSLSGTPDQPADSSSSAGSQRSVVPSGRDRRGQARGAGRFPSRRRRRTPSRPVRWTWAPCRRRRRHRRIRRRSRLRIRSPLRRRLRLGSAEVLRPAVQNRIVPPAETVGALPDGQAGSLPSAQESSPASQPGPGRLRRPVPCAWARCRSPVCGNGRACSDARCGRGRTCSGAHRGRGAGPLRAGAVSAHSRRRRTWTAVREAGQVGPGRLAGPGRAPRSRPAAPRQRGRGRAPRGAGCGVGSWDGSEGAWWTSA